jgi:hypothetical protein
MTDSNGRSSVLVVSRIPLEKFSIIQYITLNDQLTLFAKSTAGIGEPFGRKTLLSKSLFHFSTASYVVARVTSNTTNAPTASL